MGFPNGTDQVVKFPYPRWGESHFLPVSHRQSPLHLLWRPCADAPRGGMLLVHGMNEYIGRYRHVAEHFAKKFDLAGVDLHSHGLTNPVLRAADEAIRNGAGAFDASDAYLEQAALKNLAIMRQDFIAALSFLCRRSDGPIFILVHSLGGLVAASALLESCGKNLPGSDRIAGVLFVGPAFAISHFPGWRGKILNPVMMFSFKVMEAASSGGRRGAKSWWIYHGAKILAWWMEMGMKVLSLPGLRRVFAPSRPEWILDYLTDWEEEKQRMRNDGYILRKVLLCYVMAVEKEIALFRQTMKAFKWPYFLIYGTEDVITAAWGNRDFLDATLKNHPDNGSLALPVPYHEQLFMAPPTPEKILQEMDVWLRRRLQSS